MSLQDKKINWLYTINLAVVFILAIVALPMFTWPAFYAFLITLFVSVFGVTFGLHRYFSHQSFHLPKPLRYVTAFLGTFASQGGVFYWVAHHRMHHAFVETDKDPHSAAQGLWHSHVGWLLYIGDDLLAKEKLIPFARDIAADPILMAMSSLKFKLILQFSVLGFFWALWGMEVAMWATFVRIAACYTIIWSVNSFCHTYGYRNYESNDKSTNLWIMGILALGEGFHNNHHAYERVAFHGHKWWEFDFNGLVIRILEKFGIATRVRHLPRDAKHGQVAPALNSGNAVGR